MGQISEAQPLYETPLFFPLGKPQKIGSRPFIYLFDREF